MPLVYGKPAPNLPPAPVSGSTVTLARLGQTGSAPGVTVSAVGGGGAIVFSNITVGTPTTTGVNISWDVAPGAQGQIEYDTNSGVPYANSSILETGYLTYHSQSLGEYGNPPLAAGTQYYFRIKGVGPTGIVAYSAEGTFTTAAVVVGSSGRRAAVANISALSYPSYVSWKPTNGTIYTMPIGYNQTQQDSFIASVPNGTITNPSIIVFPTGNTWSRATAFRVYYTRSYTIFWGYGATINMTGTAGNGYDSGFVLSDYARAAATVGAVHHIKILGFDIGGTNAGAGTINARGYGGANEYQNGVLIGGWVEDVEIADVYNHNVHGDNIHFENGWTPAQGSPEYGNTVKRISIHHNELALCGRTSVVPNLGLDIHIRNNIIRDAAWACIGAEDSETALNYIQNMYIADNTMYNDWWASANVAHYNPYTIYFAYGDNSANRKKLGYADNLQITGNTFGGARPGALGGPADTAHPDSALIWIGTPYGDANTDIPFTDLVITGNDYSSCPPAQRFNYAVKSWGVASSVISNNNWGGAVSVYVRTSTSTSGITWVPAPNGIAWPTGIGWTAGAQATARANIQALITGSSGTSPTNRYLHRPAPGARYTIDAALDFRGTSYVTLDGGGTPVLSATGGNIGGAEIMCTNTSQVFGTRTAISSGWGGYQYMCTDLQILALTIPGLGPPGDDWTNGIDFWGVDGGEIAYCNIDNARGYGINIADSSAGFQGSFISRNILIRNNRLTRGNTQNIALIWSQNVRIEDNYWDGAGIDIEPNFTYQGNGPVYIRRNTGGDLSSTTIGRPPIGMTGTASLGWYVGDLEVTDNTFIGPQIPIGNPGQMVNGDFVSLWGPHSAGFLRLTGNRRTANAHTAPAFRFANFTGGGIVDNNHGFLIPGPSPDGNTYDFVERYNSNSVTIGSNS